MTTNLMVTTITVASDYYVGHSQASPHHSTAPAPTPSAARGLNGAAPPIPPRPRALVFLTSEKTRKGMSTVHTVSGQAVKISGKTISTIDSMIRRAMGAKPKRTPFLAPGRNATLAPSASGYPGQIPPRSPSPGSKSVLSPPPYSTQDKPSSSSYFSSSRSAPSSRVPSPGPSSGGPPPLPPRMTSKEKALISVELLLSTLEDSVGKLVNSGSNSLANVMGHKYVSLFLSVLNLIWFLFRRYGPEAAESSRLLTGTAKNVGLVYVDVRGIGRRALLRRAGKTFVKARLSGNRPDGQVVAPVQ